MAIIYSYPSEGVVTGKEEVLVTVPGEENSLRTINIQQISNLTSESSGVSRVLFNDSIGLLPSMTDGAQDPLAGTGVVEVTGAINAGAGGTGKQIADISAANIGDILIVNANQDGYDFSAQPTGETYTFSTEQNATVPANVDLFIEDSQSNKDIITLIPTGAVSLTADAVNSTITINSTGGGTALTAGSGIDITTNVISAKVGPGLQINTSEQIVPNISEANLGDAPSQGFANGDILVYNGFATNNLQWTKPSFISSANKTNIDFTLWYEDSTGSPQKHTNLTYVDKEAIVYEIGTFSIFKFIVRFKVDNANSTLLTVPGASDVNRIVLGGINVADEMLDARIDKVCTGGVVNVANCEKTDGTLQGNNWRCMPQVMTMINGDSAEIQSIYPWFLKPEEWNGCVSLGFNQTDFNGGTQTYYAVPNPTGWVDLVEPTDIYTLSGTMSFITIDAT